MSHIKLQKKYIASMCFYVIGLLTIHAPATAQPENERWHQVELIVFARTQDTGQEHWPNNIKLSYPNNWAELIKEGDPATGSAFHILSAQNRQLNTEAKKLAQNPRFNLLFHEAWIQTIGNKTNALNVIINGGKQFGPHQELEGTINLSGGTYFKLQTNLWYAQFDINSNQTPLTAWPKPPIRPNYHKNTTHNEQGEMGSALADDTGLAQALAKENNNGLIAAADDEFITRQVILVKQTRDLRSNETHYLDHPLIGMILKITPYTSSTTAPLNTTTP